MSTTLLPAPTEPNQIADDALRVMFITTTLDVGGAETMLINIVRRFDRRRAAPEICCLKGPGELGTIMAREVPLFDRLLSGKYDLRVLGRLTTLMRRRRIDAVVTVGAGDKMFWGRLAARMAGVPVVASALHSTGWPDVVGRLNHWLTPLTDAFIACAPAHGQYLIEQQKFPAERVHVIPNGVDTVRFQLRPGNPALRRQLGLPDGAAVACILAALRPEKNHEMFLDVADRVRREVPAAHFLIVGDGQRRSMLEQRTAQLGLTDAVHFLGTRSDVPELLSVADVVLLTSHMEANPVSILEALAVGKPVIATRVGSVPQTVLDREVGYLVEPGDAAAMAGHVVDLFRRPELAAALGAAGRQHVVAHASLEQTVEGYEDLLESLYRRKTTNRPAARRSPPR
ncbi:MAG TPA: glycosyltransferase [Pirellulales bacterium]|jgi:glycosyltransferase involved in cell wall biosynthesis|nr:glycosyltransferase [Pirellulales bacterium]